MWVESIVCNISVVFWDTVYYADIRGDVTSNDSWVVENGNFQCFRSLYLLNV